MPDFDRISLPVGEAIFSQRAIRRVKPDPIAEADVRLILQAAGRAPSASNKQPWHFVVVTDQEIKDQLGVLFTEAWWARRHAAGIHTPEQVPAHDAPALRLSGELNKAPVLILACNMPSVIQNEILAAVQNLLLAARGLGIGGTVVSFGPSVDDRVRALVGMPDDARLAYCIQLGYPEGKFGPANRKPLTEIASLNHWGGSIPWAAE